MIDGIDGSGKSTIINTWEDILEKSGKKVFELKSFWEKHNRHPELEEIPENTFAIISAEPTYVWTGSAVRQELIQNGKGYSALAVATGFSLQRLVLYKRILVPAREKGIHIIQDRGVSTSLCYQPIQSNGEISMDEIAQLEGNAFALENAPDILMLLDISPEKCMERLGGRTEKNDNAIFERLDFQKKTDQCYKSEEFLSFFRSKGTQIESFNADQELDILKSQLHSYLINYLSIEI